MIVKFYSWFCSFTIQKWTKFKTFTAFLRHDEKSYPLIWLLVFLALGIFIEQDSPLISAHTTLAVTISVVIGALLGHLFW